MISKDDPIDHSCKASVSSTLDDALANTSEDTDVSVVSTTKLSIAEKKRPTIEGPLFRDPICPCWSQLTNKVHGVIRRFVVVLADHAARHPITYIVAITTLSIAMAALGLFTNFNVQVDYDIIYAPHGSRPKEHMHWINHEAGFPEGTRPLTLLLHNEGENVISIQGVQQMFQVIETITSTEGYAEICSNSVYSMEYPNGTAIDSMCNTLGVTRFWYFDENLFNDQVKTDRQVMRAISNTTYPDGVPVGHDFILGQYEKTDQTIVYNPELDPEIVWRTEETITIAKSFLETVLLPDAAGVKEFELAAIENLMALREKWQQAASAEKEAGMEHSTMQLEFFTVLSYETEFQRAIFADIPLVFFVGAIMVGFTCLVFFKRDRIQSRSLLGISSVHSIAMALFMAHGILFTAGIPFTNMNMMLPFIGKKLYGVGWFSILFG